LLTSAGRNYQCLSSEIDIANFFVRAIDFFPFISYFELIKPQGESLLIAENDTEIYPFPGKVRFVVWTYFGFQKIKPGPAIKEYLNMQ